jgi:hypothetical protein
MMNDYKINTAISLRKFYANGLAEEKIGIVEIGK